MTNLAIKVFKTFFAHSDWKELRKFLDESIEFAEEMTVLIDRLVQQRDEAFDLAKEAIRQRDETLRELVKVQKFMSSNTFWKDESIQ